MSGLPSVRAWELSETSIAAHTKSRERCGLVLVLTGREDAGHGVSFTGRRRMKEMFAMPDSCDQFQRCLPLQGCGADRSRR